MHDIVEASGSPRPWRRDDLVKALGVDSPAVQNRVAVEPGSGRPAEQAFQPKADPPSAADTGCGSVRSRSTARTGTRHAQRSDRDERRVDRAGGIFNNKAARDESRCSEGLAYGIDSFCETSTSRRHNVIKTESEPLFHAETHSSFRSFSQPGKYSEKL